MDLLVRTGRFVMTMAGVTVFVVTQMILSLWPSLLKKFHDLEHVKEVTGMGITDMKVKEYMWDFGKLSTLLTLYRSWFKDSFYKESEKNGKTPNPKVLTSDGKTIINLLDSAQPGRPLVLNFGSCS